MKKAIEQKSKSALRKAKSGLLLVNNQELSDVISRGVNYLSKAPLSRCDEGTMMDELGRYKAATRLSDTFTGTSKNKRGLSGDFGIWAMALITMANINDRSLQTLTFN